MSLISLEYKEFIDSPREWILDEVSFNQASTLVVGKNSTGKSRLLAVLRNLCGSIGGILPPMDGLFKISVKLKSGTFHYSLHVDNKIVLNEYLTLDDRELLNRENKNTAKLFFEKENKHIDSEFLENSLAVSSRQDNGQHPWFVEFAEWARKTRFYRFAGGFQQSHAALTSQALSGSGAKETSSTSFDTGNVISTYIKAFDRYGEPYDQAIISDMRAMGFPISDVGLSTVANLAPETLLHEAVMLFVLEDGVSTRIPQTGMSSGMFSTLALLISLNAQIFADDGKLILIDDIGEGLDFEKSVALIKVLLSKNEKHSIQLVMASNDRFVMNHVPIEQWCVLQRKNSKVAAFTYKTHKEIFDEFEYTGLSNFDFFRSNAFTGIEAIE